VAPTGLLVSGCRAWQGMPDQNPADAKPPVPAQPGKGEDGNRRRLAA